MTDIGAFYVTLQTPGHVYLGDRVKFDTLVYGPGNDFNLPGGHYRCPVNGTYVFLSTIATDEQNGVVSFNLKKDGAVLWPKIIPRNPDNQYHSGSRLWITQCTVSQQVYIETTYNETDTGQQLKGDGFTMFSGFLLVSEL